MTFTDIATAAAVLIGVLVMVAMAITPFLADLADERPLADVVDLHSHPRATARRAA